MIHQADDRRLAGQILEVFDIVLGNLAQIGAEIITLVPSLGCAQPLQGRLDLGRQPHPLENRLARGQGDHINDEAVGWIGEGNLQEPLLLPQWEDLTVLEEAQTQGLADHELGRKGFRLHHLQRQHLRHGLGHVAFGDQTKPDQHADQ